MRDKKHYLRLFKRADTAGAQLVARAVYAVRYAPDIPWPEPKVDPDILYGIAVEIGTDKEFSSEEAIALVERERHWRDALDEDPIPPWALKAALVHLVDSGAVEATTNNLGQTWLAEAAGVDPRTVRRWVSGERSLQKFAAEKVRSVIAEAMRQ